MEFEACGLNTSVAPHGPPATLTLVNKPRSRLLWFGPVLCCLTNMPFDLALWDERSQICPMFCPARTYHRAYSSRVCHEETRRERGGAGFIWWIYSGAASVALFCVGTRTPCGDVMWLGCMCSLGFFVALWVSSWSPCPPQLKHSTLLYNIKLRALIPSELAEIEDVKLSL